MKRVTLNSDEIAKLDEQNPAAENDGGYQKLLVRFQKGLNRSTGELEIEDVDLSRISHYAFDIGRGGWEDRLIFIFGRTLGQNLGR